MKVRATPGATPEVVSNAEPRPWEFSMTRWAPDGKWIAYPVANGIDLITPGWRLHAQAELAQIPRIQLFERRQ